MALDLTSDEMRLLLAMVDIGVDALLRGNTQCPAARFAVTVPDDVHEALMEKLGMFVALLSPVRGAA